MNAALARFARTVAFVACGVPLAMVSAAKDSAGFDFAYRIAGDREARPVQVFDDGHRTYFQFPPGAAVPAMTAGPGRVPVVPRLEAPFHVVDGVPRQFTLVTARHRARVEAVDAPAAAGVHAMPIANGAVSATPGSAHAHPVRGDVVAEAHPPARGQTVVRFDPARRTLTPQQRADLARLAAQVPDDAVVSVQPGPSPAGRRQAEAVRRALVDGGLPPDRAALRRDGATAIPDVVAVTWRDPAPRLVAQQAHGRPLPHHFDILLSDRTVSRAMRRWAESRGLALDWQSAVDAPVTGDLTLDARTIDQAVDRTLAALQAHGYPLTREAAGDNVIRIVRTPVP